jgi:twitching motility protein PilT
MNINDILRRMVKAKASDLFLKVGSPPAMRIDGRIRFLQAEAVSPDQSKEFLETIFKTKRRKNLTLHREQDLSYDVPGIGRFRCNISRQRGHLFFVLRVIQKAEMTFEELHLPKEPLMKLAALERGLVLVTGTTGSGKSTSLAGIINYINQNWNKHIVTVEDPIEFIYKDKRSIITQREIGADTESFSAALKYALRQAPDVILIGEMRDKETMEAAFHAAETGHLVFSTLHTTNAVQTVERIINYFPPHQQALVRGQLAMVLEGVISQRLGVRKSGKGRVPAIELMIKTPTIRDMLREGNPVELSRAIAESGHYGCQTFNQSLVALIKGDLITMEEGMRMADNPDELKMEFRGIQKGTRVDYDDSGYN